MLRLSPHVSKIRLSSTLEDYRERISSFQEQSPDVNHPLFSTISVIEMGINFEEASILWCNRMLEVLKQHKLTSRTVNHI
ncbi:hypothetical protein [Paenibacillus sp. TH7-28]